MDAIRPLACRPRAFTTMSLDRRFESVASIEFHDYDYVAENSTLARHDNLPRAPAYMFKINKVIRASLFVSGHVPPPPPRPPRRRIARELSLALSLSHLFR